MTMHIISVVVLVLLASLAQQFEAPDAVCICVIAVIYS
jgi:hypothetical protein